MRLALVVLLACAACASPDSNAGSSTASGSSNRRFGSIGREAQADEIKAWDIDANPSGAGLPAGEGTYARGATVYAQQCAVCHGPKGEGGVPPNAKLIAAATGGFTFATDPKLAKTIGNYWPYATTLYDYINRAMPFNAPGTLQPTDVYSVVAYLLAENGIIQQTDVMNASTLPQVKMPARDRFVADDRRGGATFK